jgi:DUF1680 family protein
MPQVGGLAYGTEKDKLYVNLFMNGQATINLDGGKTVRLEQETDYPWDGKVKLTVAPGQEPDLTVCLRIPGWALGHPVPSGLYHFEKKESPPIRLKVKGTKTDVTPEEDGYVHLRRQWKPGDTIELDLPMPVRRVYAHEKVEANRGKTALMRGPIVYCLEAVDHDDVDVTRLALSRATALRAEYHPQLLGGVTVIAGDALLDGGRRPITAVPYYAWCNREKGAMTVWINEDE